jgi:hypothetical protein
MGPFPTRVDNYSTLSTSESQPREEGQSWPHLLGQGRREPPAAKGEEERLGSAAARSSDHRGHEPK